MSDTIVAAHDYDPIRLTCKEDSETAPGSDYIAADPGEREHSSSSLPAKPLIVIDSETTLPPGAPASRSPGGADNDHKGPFQVNVSIYKSTSAGCIKSYHTGISCDGREYTLYEFYGVQHGPPENLNKLGNFHKRIELGQVQTLREFSNCIEKHKNTYSRETFDAINRNGNDFVEAVMMDLFNTPLPKHVNRLARVMRSLMCRCCIPAVQTKEDRMHVDQKQKLVEGREQKEQEEREARRTRVSQSPRSSPKNAPQKKGTNRFSLSSMRAQTIVIGGDKKDNSPGGRVSSHSRVSQPNQKVSCPKNVGVRSDSPRSRTDNSIAQQNNGSPFLRRESDATRVSETSRTSTTSRSPKSGKAYFGYNWGNNSYAWDYGVSDWKGGQWKGSKKGKDGKGKSSSGKGSDGDKGKGGYDDWGKGDWSKGGYDDWGKGDWGKGDWVKGDWGKDDWSKGGYGDWSKGGYGDWNKDGYGDDWDTPGQHDNEQPSEKQHNDENQTEGKWGNNGPDLSLQLSMQDASMPLGMEAEHFKDGKDDATPSTAPPDEITEHPDDAVTPTEIRSPKIFVVPPIPLFHSAVDKNPPPETLDLPDLDDKPLPASRASKSSVGSRAARPLALRRGASVKGKIAS